MKTKLFLILAAFTLVGAAAWAGTGATDADADGGGAMTGGKYTQSPFLDARVASGELPPVDERLPIEPMVVTPLDEIGTYGGQLTIFSNEHPNPWARLVGENPEGAPFFVGINFDDMTLYPRLAKGWEMADDYTSITLYLREGTKWSNGDPFTSEDIRFAHHEMRQKELGYIWGAGSLESIIAIDDYTVRYEYPQPVPKLVTDLGGCCLGSNWAGYAPSTWLKQWHAEYNSDAPDIAKEEGFDTWQDAFTEHSRFCCPQVDMEMPTMFPFMLTEVTQQFRTKERNPYYFGVDTAGQQLPYIDTALIQKIDRETIPLKIMSGESDFAERTVADYPMLLEAQDGGGYAIKLLSTGWEGTGVAWMFNLNSADPQKREIFNNIEFRRAMSLALNRDRINDVEYLGQGVPVAVATLFRGASIYKPEWGEDHPYVGYDPDRASRMLDAIGLDKRNADGIRLMPDGRPLVIVFPMQAEKASAPNELLKEDFEAVGVGLELRTASSIQTDVGMREGTVDIAGCNEVHSEMGDYGSGTGGINQWVDFMMWQWSQWWYDEHDNFRSPGDSNRDPMEPPQEVKDYMRVQILESKSHPFGSREQKRLSSMAWQMVSDNMWQLGGIQAAPVILTYDENLMNVPTEVGNAGDINGAFAPFTDQMFFKNQ